MTPARRITERTTSVAPSPDCASMSNDSDASCAGAKGGEDCPLPASPAAPETFPREHHLWGDTEKAETGSYYLRPLGRPVIEAYFGGDHARALAAEGPRAAADFAIEELVSVYGADIRPQLRLLAATSWSQDPWALGAYSHALPGCAPARQVLAEPVEGRLFFAGEATSTRAFSRKPT